MSPGLKSRATFSASSQHGSVNKPGMASRTASYERRADDWVLNHNLAAHELMQIGRQILTSLIAEQVAHREYLNIKKQIENSEEVDRFLHEKFSNAELYAWMQGEIVAPLLRVLPLRLRHGAQGRTDDETGTDAPRGGRHRLHQFQLLGWRTQGLLSGEALYLISNEWRWPTTRTTSEFELTKHVSLRQLDPLALLALKATGACEVTVPEWLFDLDGPGHYIRRIKNVSLSIPSVTGPYTSVRCTLSLLKSSLRKSPLAEGRRVRSPG